MIKKKKKRVVLFGGFQAWGIAYSKDCYWNAEASFAKSHTPITPDFFFFFFLENATFYMLLGNCRRDLTPSAQRPPSLNWIQCPHYEMCLHILWWGPALCSLQPMYHLCVMRVLKDIEVKWVAQNWKWNLWNLMFLLLLFSYWVMSDSLWPSELQHTRLPCSSLSPGVCSNSCPLSQWCHPTISFSVAPFSSCHQSFPASGS